MFTKNSWKSTKPKKGSKGEGAQLSQGFVTSLLSSRDLKFPLLTIRSLVVVAAAARRSLIQLWNLRRETDSEGNRLAGLRGERCCAAGEGTPEGGPDVGGGQQADQRSRQL